MHAKCGSGTPAPPSFFFKSARLPRSMNSNMTLTELVLLCTKPAYHWTRLGHPSADTRPRISFKSCSRFGLSSTFTVLMATRWPVDLSTPRCTAPHAPDPRCLEASTSMSSGERRYSLPITSMPASGEIFVPLILWRIVPLASIDQVIDTEASSSKSSISKTGLGFLAMLSGTNSRRALRKLEACCYTKTCSSMAEGFEPNS
mmetsp:Transcript_131671/g.228107  ORF Transcript_131671/g.228107 Transcript_131671/m.228107 type:complete len:202 (-) Transcript_131671:8-613(-)